MAPRNPTDELGLPEEAEQLRAQVAALSAAVAERDRQLAERDTTIESLNERIRLLLAQRFGPKSERVAEAQQELFDEPEATLAEAAQEEAPEAVEVPAHRRRRGKRAPLPAGLPRVDIVHELAEAERVCPHDGARLEAFGEETSEQLDIVPAKVQVLRHRRIKYRCACCEEHVVSAPLPAQPIPKSQASPGLLSFVATAKYADALPLYRQSKQFERLGIELPRQTLARWMVACAELCQPLMTLYREALLTEPYIHADETTVQVLKEPGRPADSQSRLWCLASGSRERPVHLFHYDPSRAGEVAERLLGDFSGYLQTDGYPGYDAVVAANGITRVGCLAHARRYFTDGLKSLGINPKKVPPKPPPKAARLLRALRYFKTLYAIERRIRERPPDERHAVRQAESKPVLDQLHAWASETLARTPPKTSLGKALGYLLRQWPTLIRYLDDGRLEIDNNRVENAIRPFAVGRRNWLFSDSQAGAAASATLYSLIETAKANSLEPYAYLRHVFAELPSATTVEDIEALLAWNVKPASLP